MNKAQILKCSAREILDSRGNPTVEATVFLDDGTTGVASVPSGASTGIYEAHELRDGDTERFDGKGVLEAVRGITRIISPELAGMCASDQGKIDAKLIELDGTENKTKLGANAILAVSLANAKAAANRYGLPLYRYIGGTNTYCMPVPMMNILNGGVHASNNIEIQEFMIVPTGADSFSEALRISCEIYHTLGRILKADGHNAAVGDEGGYAPDLSDDEKAIELICTAINEAGYDTDKVGIALDAAASEWYCEQDDRYRKAKRGENYTRSELIDYWEKLCGKYPIISLEDALDQRDFDGWKELTDRLSDKVMLVGDDLFVTNERRLKRGIGEKAANAILIKPNQTGTLSEVFRVTSLAQQAGYGYILSHRSGETGDTSLADIAVGVSAGYIKAGAPCRGERVAKYNRLLRIESYLGNAPVYGKNGF